MEKLTEVFQKHSIDEACEVFRGSFRDVFVNRFFGDNVHPNGYVRNRNGESWTGSEATCTNISFGTAVYL